MPLGYKHSEEVKRKIGLIAKGRPGYWLGKKRSDETKRKISINNGSCWKGKKLPQEMKDKIAKKSLFQKGHKHSKEVLEKLKKYTRERNSNWRGGSSFEPYGLEFNKTLKEIVRSRDNDRCQVCQKPQEEETRRLSIHHIDYNKKNCKLSNLVSLCGSCHMKTNYQRDYWIEYFLTKNHRVIASEISNEE